MKTELVTLYDYREFLKHYRKLISTMYPVEQHAILLSQGIDPDHYKESYVLIRDRDPVACLSLYTNRFAEYGDDGCGCIGNYECIADHTISARILDHAFQKARDYHMKHLIGPMNGATWFNYRFRLNNDTSPFFTEAWNPDYYNQQFTDQGFKPAAHYYSALDTNCRIYPMDRVEAKLKAAGIRYRNIDLENYETELRKIYDFSIRAFEHNFLFSPIGFHSFADKYRKIKDYLNPKFIFLAEQDNTLTGFVFGIPDHLYKSAPRMILKTVAALPGSQYWGLGMSLTNRLTEASRKEGYESVIHAYMLDHNKSTMMSKKYNADPFVHYALYEKTIA